MGARVFPFGAAGLLRVRPLSATDRITPCNDERNAEVVMMILASVVFGDIKYHRSIEVNNYVKISESNSSER